MGGGASVIRTPDQRLRVFVSSTLSELAPERRVIRAVIERLALTPVMFELGARPHPPRSLYRAYLAQSEIFIGIYWESYGWVAPGEDVSGLEDEYNLAPDVPKLIYIKRSEQRDERLEALLERIRDDDRASYVAFDDAEELAPLLTSDLATLLAERFEAGSRRASPPDVEPDPASSHFRNAPTPLTRLIGRESELQRVVDQLTTDGGRLVTLTGPGGIGKTRLAIATAHEVEAFFPDGIAFVDLAPIRKPRLVVPAIAAALGIPDSGDAPLQTRLGHALSRRRVLLLLDNVEHVVDAAADLSALLTETSVSMLATSRIPLHIDGEHSIPLTPLASAAGIELFVERARAVKPEFGLTDDNAADVSAIVAALDSIPLALELAAARLLVITPAALLERLDQALSLLVGGARDRPERQRTLRATIDWSARLLSDPEHELFLRLGVFRNGFSLDAAEWMCNGLDAGAMDLLTGLVESSLVQEQDRGPRPWFTMLATVREYARDELERRGDLQQWRQRHAEFFSGLALLAEPHLIGAEQGAWIARLRDEFEDLRAAVDHYFDAGQADAVADLVWPLYWFWWTAGLREATEWVGRVVGGDYDVSERTRVRSEFYLAGVATVEDPDPSRIPDLEEYLAYFMREHDVFNELLTRLTIASCEMMLGPSGLDPAEKHLERAETLAASLSSPFLASMALLIEGQIPLMRGDMPTAIAKFDASLDAARASGELLSQSAALFQLGWMQLLLGDHGGAADYFVQQMLISTKAGHDQGIANGLDGLFAVSVAAGDVERAGTLLGAADDLRERRGLLGPAMLPYFERALADVEASPAAHDFAIARERGKHADFTAVVEEALRR